jgi:multiple sugar transport system permease protein
VITVWWIVGFGVLIFLGALQKIPPEQYESAMIDGAGIWARFQHITLPWIRNVLIFETVRQVILAFGLFDQVLILTGGGPGGATRTMVFYMYQMGFDRHQLGLAAAMSWYIFVIIVIFGLIQLAFITRSVRSAED